MSKGPGNGILRLLRVAIVGAPNAGKSTLLNKLISSEVSCVSNKVHTTRKNVLGVYTNERNDTQIEFLDSPGIITKQHVIRHNLDQSMLSDPKAAVQSCDIIAVMQDISNIREQKNINRGVIKLLEQHSEVKRSILILNKVDLLKDKRKLLDISTRLTGGRIEGNLTLPLGKIKKMPVETVRDLNLIDAHNLIQNERSKLPEKEEYIANKFGNDKEGVLSDICRKYKNVFELKKLNEIMENSDGDVDINSIYRDPDVAGVSINEDYQDKMDSIRGFYPNFSQVFSISALNNDGIDELRNYMLDMANPVETLPRGPNFLTNLTTKEIVDGIIRGKLMNCTDSATPYSVKYRYYFCQYDELGTLHIELNLICPKKFMVLQILGEKGSNIEKITEDSRNLISKEFGCEVKLRIHCNVANEKKSTRL